VSFMTFEDGEAPLSKEVALLGSSSSIRGIKEGNRHSNEDCLFDDLVPPEQPPGAISTLTGGFSSSSSPLSGVTSGRENHQCAVLRTAAMATPAQDLGLQAGFQLPCQLPRTGEEEDEEQEQAEVAELSTPMPSASTSCPKLLSPLFGAQAGALPHATSPERRVRFGDACTSAAAKDAEDCRSEMSVSAATPSSASIEPAIRDPKMTVADSSDEARSVCSPRLAEVIRSIGYGDPSEVYRIPTALAMSLGASPCLSSRVASPSLRAKSRTYSDQLDIRTPTLRSEAPSWPTILGAHTLRGEHSVKHGCSAIHDEYRIIAELGRGSFGVVKKAARQVDGEEVAIKSILVGGMQADDHDYLQHELDIAKRLRHPNIAVLYTIYKESEIVHLVMELCVGGDLFSRIAKGQFFSEQRIIIYLWQMMSGIAYCHYNNFCHRDLKPENYLLSSRQGDATLKLIDFGLACVFKKGTPMTSCVGSVYYVAPEVFRGSYDEKRDIWSIGIIAHMLGTMRAPFQGKTEEAIIKEIMDGRLDLVWLEARLGRKNPLKLLIFKMLTVKAEQRPSAKELTEDQWFQKKGTQILRAPRCCPGLFW